MTAPLVKGQPEVHREATVEEDREDNRRLPLNTTDVVVRKRAVALLLQDKTGRRKKVNMVPYHQYPIFPRTMRTLPRFPLLTKTTKTMKRKLTITMMVMLMIVSSKTWTDPPAGVDWQVPIKGPSNKGNPLTHLRVMLREAPFMVCESD